jgi:hypothetical protein
MMNHDVWNDDIGRNRGKQGQGWQARKEAAQEESEGETGGQEAKKGEVTARI